ncbi:hypothetical protein Tco_0679094, partial [Tanacetum coccineum]
GERGETEKPDSPATKEEEMANEQEVTLRTDCQAIISFYNKTNSNKSSRVRWIKFADAVTGTCVKINIEHIEGKHNTLADSLSRLVNLCFAECTCTGEMKELAAVALYLVEEVIQSPNAFQKNMKTTCEEVMKISNHFLESSQKLSSHLKNQEHYTNVTSSRPIKPQSEWINLMHGDQSPKTLNFQQQKKQLKPCETYKQSYNAKPKYALDNQPKTTTGQTKEKMFEFKTKKPEESSSNWKPWHKDWDAITSNHSEDDAIKDDGKYRYNRKGFLEDDESSDDSILIVDPGWDDYCLQELKLNRPVPLCLEARRALGKCFSGSGLGGSWSCEMNVEDHKMHLCTLSWCSVGIDIENMIDDQSFAQLYNDDDVGLCCLGILQLVILGVESKRDVLDWMLRLANDRIAWDK